METNRKSYVDFSKNPYFNPSNGPKRKFQGYFHIIFFLQISQQQLWYVWRPTTAIWWIL